jgi:hypothetical protein
LSMLKHKLNYTHHKSILCCASKPSSTNEQINAMIQMKDGNYENNKQNNVCKLTSHKSFLIHGICKLHAFLFPIAYMNYFNKITILFNPWKCIWWILPHTHPRIPMRFNNLLDVNLTNKGCEIFCKHCALTWSWSHSTFFFFPYPIKLFCIPHLSYLNIVQNTTIHWLMVLLPWPP